tara:strand:- start:106781 stop:107503 length:723 start_codon:yes stop_codon:yes gene_type:complete
MPISNSHTAAAVLGVSPTATVTEVKKAYKKLAFKYHPDRNETGDSAMFAHVKEAYDLLITSVNRRPNPSKKNQNQHKQSDFVNSYTVLDIITNRHKPLFETLLNKDLKYQLCGNNIQKSCLCTLLQFMDIQPTLIEMDKLSNYIWKVMSKQQPIIAFLERYTVDLRKEYEGLENKIVLFTVMVLMDFNKPGSVTGFNIYGKIYYNHIAAPLFSEMKSKYKVVNGKLQERNFMEKTYQNFA